MIASEPLPHFVDDLLAYLYEAHPTYATLDGVHTHDDLLEDLSRQGIESDARALAGYLRRLEEISQEGLTEIERLEHRMLTAHLRPRSARGEFSRNCARHRASSRPLGTTSRTLPASSSKSASRPCGAPSSSSRRSCRAPSATSTIYICSATWPMRRRRPHGLSAPLSTTSRQKWRRALVRRSGWGATGSSRSCGSTRALAFRSIGCSPSPTASCGKLRKPSSRWPAG